jgi:hypothetical protein
MLQTDENNYQSLPWKYVAPEEPTQGMEDWIEDADGNVVVENVGSLRGPFICDSVNVSTK